MTMPPIAVVGAGAFGTALACVAAQQGSAAVTLFARDAEQARSIAASRENSKSLAGVALPATISATADPDDLSHAETVLLAMPAQAVRPAVESLLPFCENAVDLVICAKGIERASHRFLSEIVAERAGKRRVSVLSGPGFARDIAAGLPTAMTIANGDIGVAQDLADRLSGETFRLYASDDVVGVEIGGALKNVLAIACGIVDGAALGQSARAALIARGLAEMARFAVSHGARPETLTGLSGLGDLVLTATSEQSRNFRYGRALGRGQRAGALTAPGEPLCEGAFTAGVAATIASGRAIDMPITQAVAAIVDERSTVDEAVAALLRRPLRSER